MRDSLKPCPFCGGQAENSTGQISDGKPWHYVECVDCGAIGPTYGEYAAHNIAVTEWRSDQWNRRTILTELKG